MTLIQVNLDEISVVAGDFDLAITGDSSQIFSEIACEFLISLSDSILKDDESRDHGDVMAFAYWCRKSNLTKMRSEYSSTTCRKGRGLVFHIAPSNVPINFAFSFAFSLIAGNSNIVRLPSKHVPQEDYFFKHYLSISTKPDFVKIKNSNVFIKYDRRSGITEQISKIVDARMIWGGDRTVQEITDIKTPLHSVDICFVDKYSFSVIDARSILELPNSDLENLANRFYNDAYIFDQNACSSPRTVFWVGSKEEVKSAQARFWQSVEKIVEKRYEIEDSSRVKKYLDLCLLAADPIYDSLNFKIENKLVTRIESFAFDYQFLNVQNRFGTFMEIRLDDLQLLPVNLTPKFQTATYFGFGRDELTKLVTSVNLKGIDRFVPIGNALDMDIRWDGYDLPVALSRVITIK